MSVFEHKFWPILVWIWDPLDQNHEIQQKCQPPPTHLFSEEQVVT
jgi:hypothetical protein